MKNIFVVNAGSSSLKYQLINMENESVLIYGNCERIGTSGGPLTYHYGGKKLVIDEDLPTHRYALERVLQLMTAGETRVMDNLDEVIAVGHRIAISFRQSVEITDEIIKEIKGTEDIAPLHVPAMLTVISACQELFHNKVQVAVFDNSFHLTMPPKAYLYAIPYEYYEKYKIRRYGYHGTSHRYVSQRLANLMGKNIADLKIISCHLGNGSSICAINGGKSVDTSMGYTPMAGLLMGTRSGDIDPSIIFHIAKREGLNLEQMNEMLNKKSGMLGVSGCSSDNRDVEQAAHEGSVRADLAEEMVYYQIKKYIGSYTAVMNGADAIIFTGGIGENSITMRRHVCTDMEALGIVLDEVRNETLNGREGKISAPTSKLQVWIVPTDEELMIARDAYDIYRAKQKI